MIDDLPQPPRSRLRRYFFTGILVTAPIGLTLYLAWLFIAWVDNLVTPYLPAGMNPNDYLPFAIPGVGLIVAFVLLTLIGALTAGVLGSWLTRLVEWMVNRLPVVKTIYSVIKQVLHTTLADQSQAFREAVLVEFPRRDMWVLGFVTGRARTEVDLAIGQKMVSVLVPTTPTLTSGYMIFVPETDIRPINMPAEQALRLVISGGLVS